MNKLAWAEISLDAISHNFKYLSSCSSGQLMAVIKADAYGHGSIKVAQALSDNCDMFAVARIEEAIALRDAGIQQKITILSGCVSTDHFKLCETHHFTPCIYNQTGLSNAIAINQTFDIWLKIDTGMHRLGLTDQEINNAIKNIENSQLKLFGIMSHFACADTPNAAKNQIQNNAFSDILDQHNIATTSIENSAALLEKKQQRHHWQRAGIALYGINPQGNKALENIKPVMQLKSRVIHIQKIKKGETVGYGETWQAKKDSSIATVAIGYADGYPRHAKNGTPVLINGEQLPLAGRVSMDLITVDISNAKHEIKIGDEVTLWGKGLPCEIIAEHCQSIAYELLSQVNKRVDRIYT